VAAFQLLAFLVALLAAQAAGAAGVAWDPIDEPGLTGYRIYIGTAPGRPTQVFDVGPVQASFVYTAAVPGQEYFISVATRARGLVGEPTPEIRVTAGATISTLTSESPLRFTPARAGADAGTPGLTELGSGLEPISSLSFDSGGHGLFIEGDSKVRYIGPAGLSAEPALETSPGTRFLSVALDPKFGETGLVYVAAATPGRDGQAELQIVRYRLLAGVLGEPATLVTERTASGAAVLAISADRILVVQDGAVSRFELDGTVPRDQPGSAPTWATTDVRPLAALWDDARGALWVIGRDRDGSVAVQAVGSGGTSRVTNVVSADSQAQVGASVVSGRPDVQLVSSGRVTAIDLDSGARRLEDVSRLGAPVAAWAPAPRGGAYAAVEQAHGSGAAAFTLLHLAPAPESSPR
jgi:hypothetical protein